MNKSVYNFHIKHSLLLLLIFFLCILLTTDVKAQSAINEVSYGETRSGSFANSGNEPTERWLLIGAEALDIPIIRVHKISGHFTPSVRLLDVDGNILATSQNTSFSDTSEIIYDTGLPSSNMYQIEVVAQDIISNEADNPIAYSITVTHDGKRRENRDEGISPLPTVGLNPPPELQVGDAQQLSLRIDAYGQEATVTSSPTPNIPARFLITTNQWELTVNEAVPISRGATSVTFIEAGIGLTLRNIFSSGDDKLFFSDENFMVAYSEINDTYTFTMSSGMVITSDFASVQSIQVENGVAAFQMQIGEVIKRLVFDTPSVNLRQLTSGTNEAALYQIDFQDDEFIVSDFLGWDTLAYYQGQARIYYGTDARILSDDVHLSIRQDNENLHSLTLIGDNNLRRLEVNIEWMQISGVRIEQGNLSVDVRNGVSASESIENLTSVFLEDGAIQFTRRDGTYRRIFPDGTDIHTPVEIANATDVLPYEPNYRPSNYNNLGANIIPVCPCINGLEDHIPVNLANGNFFYSVEDFSTFNTTLPLNLTRYYNSQDNHITPNYLVDSPTNYLQFGLGWRHSFQHELDITGAPIGTIRYIEPDGTSHYFSPSIDNDTEWTSSSLFSLVISRNDGLLGEWFAQRSDGLTYHFDRVGRLKRISSSPNHSILLSPAPLLGESSSTGLFIVDTYGRRLELYTGQSDYIEIARDTLARTIEYSYDNGKLVNINYHAPSLGATYEYNSVDVLRRFDDVRSPYLQTGSIEYDEQLRVVTYIENFDGSQAREYTYLYNHTNEERRTSRGITVNEEHRLQHWDYDDAWQLTTLSLPREGWIYEFVYNSDTKILESVRTPTQVRFSMRHDERGNLLRFEDPFFVGDNDYEFSYEQRGQLNLLTEIRYPNNRTDTFTWSDGEYPLLISHETLVTDNPIRSSRITRYQYDEWNRLTMTIAPNSIATLYQYDTVGYISEIWQGIEVVSGEVYTDIVDNGRATSILELQHNSIGQLLTIADGLGEIYTLTWDINGNLVTISGANDISTTYNYDQRGNLTNINENGQETLYTYNGLDLLTSVTDSLSSVQNYAYDEVGNLLRTVDNLQRETTYQYDALDNLTQSSTPSGLITQYSTELDMDGDFVIRRIVEPNGRTLEGQYDALGRLRLYRIELNEFVQEFNFVYSSIGYLNRIIETTSGRTILVDYNLIGDILDIDVSGSETSFVYDDSSRLQQIISPAERITRYTYDNLGNISALTLPDNSTWLYEYDANSNLVTEINPIGQTTRYTYDALNQLLISENPLGNSERYRYDIRGNIIEIIDARGISTNNSYDELNRLISSIDGEGNETTYEYDSVGRLININQPSFRGTRLTYDTEDNLIAITERPSEQRTLFSHDAFGRITSITDPLGRTMTYQYNPIGRISTITDAVGNIEQYSWRTETGYLSSYTNSANRNYVYNTDELGRVTSIRDLSPSDTEPINTQMFYDDDGYILGIQVGSDSARASGNNDRFYQYEYGTGRFPIQYIDERGSQWELRRNDVGQIIEVINPNGVSTQYIYDDLGQVIQVIHQSSSENDVSEFYEYDANGNLIAYTSRSGIRNEYSYDANNLLRQAFLAVGTDTNIVYEFEYDPLGQLFRVTDPNGNETRYFYLLDNLTRIERDLEEDIIAISYNYDDTGNLVAVSLPGGGDNLNLTYDTLNRRVRYVDNENNTWAYTYDLAGNVSQVSDPLGSVVSYGYDTFNRVTSIEYPSGSTTSMTYDAAGNLRTITLPENIAGDTQVIFYRLNEIGQVLEIQVGSSTTQFTYDASGYVTTRTSPDGTVTNYDYDDFGQLIAIRSENNPTLIYEYDLEGNLQQAGDNQFMYDALGQIIQATNNISINYVYDETGNIIQRNTDILGVTDYTYDGLYRVEQIAFNEQQVQFIYNNQDQITQITRDNGVQTGITYDNAGRIISIIHLSSSDERLDGFNYQYDAVGNVIRIDRVDGSRVNYSYDIEHRLIGERWLNSIGETVYVVSYRYDAVGNRIEEIRNGQRTLYTYDNQNRLIEEVRNVNAQNSASLLIPLFGFGIVIGLSGRRKKWLIPTLLLGIVGSAVFAQDLSDSTILYDYNINGNITRITHDFENNTYVLNLRYDIENRLTAVTGQNEHGEDVNTRIQYDAFSRILAINTNETNYELYYDAHTLIGMSDGENVERYFNHDGERLITIGEDGILWHLNDRRGTTRRYSNSSGELLQDVSRELEFGSFGLRIFPYSDNIIAPEGSQISQPTELYVGNLYEPSSNLYLMGFRAYNPNNGRFLQPDPIRQDPIGTLYTYARNRPLFFQDSTGMMVEPYEAQLDTDTITQQINPDDFIPEPYQQDITSDVSVRNLQADETFRVLEIIEALHFGTNDTVVQLSPYLDDIYLFELNPPPSYAQTVLTESLNNMMGMYESGEGWIPNLDPHLELSPARFQILEDIEPLVRQAYTRPLTLYSVPTSQVEIIPTVALPQGISEQWRIETELADLLQPVLVMEALVPETDSLISTIPTNITPDVDFPIVQPPIMPIEPPVLESLDALREATFDFYSQIWTIGEADCEICLTPLGFNQ